MFVPVKSDILHCADGRSLIVSACDELSLRGVKNFIRWDDVVSVDIFGCAHDVIVDYVDCGVRFVKQQNMAYNQ